MASRYHLNPNQLIIGEALWYSHEGREVLWYSLRTILQEIPKILITKMCFMVIHVVSMPITLTHFDHVMPNYIMGLLHHYFIQWLDNRWHQAMDGTKLQMAPSHYMNQCWFSMEFKFQRNFIENSNTFGHRNAPENVDCKMSAILFRLQSIKWGAVYSPL